MVRLEFQLLIGKGATGDFTVLLPAGLPITNPNAQLPTSWLQINTSNSIARSVSLWRQQDQIALVHAWRESGVDNAGRPLHKLVAYATRRPPNAMLARLLLWMYRQNFDQGTPPLRLEVAPSDLADDDAPLLCDELDRGAAALVAGADVCRVQSTKTVQGLVDAIGFEQLGFLAIVPNTVTAWPAIGPGIVLSRSAWRAPNDALDLVRLGLRPGKADVAGLMRAARVPERRIAVAIAGMTGNCATLGHVSDEELDWLLAQKRIGAAAFSLANAEQISRLVGASKIDVDQLDKLTPPQLAKVPPAILANRMRSLPDGLSRFVAMFGPGAEGVEQLLPEPAAEFARERHGIVSAPERILDLSPDDLELLDQAGIFQTMPFRWLAALQPFRPHLLTVHLVRHLREFIPDALASRMLGLTGANGNHTAASLGGNPPPPHGEWLAGIDFERLVGAGSLCMRDRAWRRWWAEAVRLHPGSQGREIATLSAPWSPETVAWLLAGAGDGQISAAELRGRIAVFLAVRAPLEKELTRLLAAAGVTRAADMAELVSGQIPSPGKVDARFAGEIRLLIDAGILTMPALRDLLGAGLSIPALSGLVDDRNAIAVVDPDAPAPTNPPTQWHPLLTAELRRQIRAAAFWKRWPQGVPQPLLVWMRDLINGEPEENVVNALLAAAQRSRVLDRAELVLVAGGIAPLDLLWQVVENARRGFHDRRPFIDFLSDNRLRVELVVFLRSELLALAGAPVVPEMAVAELIALHPLLHPARDVVRQIMSRSTVEPGEEVLLEQTVAAIQGLGPIVPLPRPNSEQAERRPGWVCSLSGLPGWEHWKTVTGEASSS